MMRAGSSPCVVFAGIIHASIEYCLRAAAARDLVVELLRLSVGFDIARRRRTRGRRPTPTRTCRSSVEVHGRADRCGVGAIVPVPSSNFQQRDQLSFEAAARRARGVQEAAAVAGDDVGRDLVALGSFGSGGVVDHDDVGPGLDRRLHRVRVQRRSCSSRSAGRPRAARTSRERCGIVQLHLLVVDHRAERGLAVRVRDVREARARARVTLHAVLAW